MTAAVATMMYGGSARTDGPGLANNNDDVRTCGGIISHQQHRRCNYNNKFTRVLAYTPRSDF